MSFRFVKIRATDGLELDGALKSSPTDVACVVHVHGKCGNFYQNAFIQNMFDTYGSENISLLSFNNRGHDCVSEGYLDGNLVYIGGSLELFSQCVEDIEGAVAFVAEHCPGRPIFLQGHSNGCEKIVYFLRQKTMSTISGAILLSAADSRRLHEQFIAPRTIEGQVSALAREPSTLGFLPLSEYGVRNNSQAYYIPIARDALLNMLTTDVLEVIRFGDNRPVEAIRLPAFAYIGGSDMLRTADAPEVRRALSRLFDKMEFLEVQEGDHHFHGLEDRVARAVADWIRANAAPGDLR